MSPADACARSRASAPSTPPRFALSWATSPASPRSTTWLPMRGLTPVYELFFCRLGRLAIHDGRARLRVPSLRLPHPSPEGVVHPFPDPVLLPAGEIPVHGIPVGKLGGQIAPLAAGAEHVENR